jgi:hypothetical protein
VQEVVLVALVVIESQKGIDHPSSVQAIREVQMDAGKHIKKVCEPCVHSADDSAAVKWSILFRRDYWAMSWSKPSHVQ